MPRYNFTELLARARMGERIEYRIEDEDNCVQVLAAQRAIRELNDLLPKMTPADVVRVARFATELSFSSGRQSPLISTSEDPQ